MTTTHGNALTGHGGFDDDVVVVEHHAGVVAEVDAIARAPVSPLERLKGFGHQ
ncbi:hypothetical protein D3C78_1912280 [compost metagenome]